MSRPERAIFILKFADTGKPGEPPTIIRLRQLLKIALRAFKFQLVEMVEQERGNSPASGKDSARESGNPAKTAVGDESAMACASIVENREEKP